MKRFEYLIEKVSGHCACGYKEGDVFHSKRMYTPEVSLCGWAFTVLFPVQVALFNGAEFHSEDNPKSKRNLACPDNGNVVFKVTMFDESE